MTPFQADVAAVLRRLQPGEVVTYGEVAEEAGHPGAGRAVGNVLGAVDGLPWWRVVTTDGRLVPHNQVEQRRRLRAEGVAVVDGRVSELRSPRLRRAPAMPSLPKARSRGR